MAKGNGKPGPKPGELVPQEHGGALRNGSETPGPGRPPSEIRKAARLAFAKRLPVLEEIADNAKRDADRIAAMKLLADTGGVDKIALTLDEQPERVMTPELRREWWEKLKRVKSFPEFERVLLKAGG